MCLFKNKFDTLKREEVIDTICELEREEVLIEEKIKILTEDIRQKLNEGREVDNPMERTFLVKKITLQQEKRERAIRQAMYILYNLRLSERLKDAIDDKSLVKKLASMKSIKYFKDQRALALFLNDALNTKIKQEDVLTEADDTFRAVEDMYQKNLQIYGITELSEDNILAFFEEGSATEPPKRSKEETA
ncbi:MAG: hypothetical protein K5923_05325 [Clostridia bacterium]|nr:hypothetical protein [Clostridia bacterium]